MKYFKVAFDVDSRVDYKPSANLLIATGIIGKFSDRIILKQKNFLVARGNKRVSLLV